MSSDCIGMEQACEVAPPPTVLVSLYFELSIHQGRLLPHQTTPDKEHQSSNLLQGPALQGWPRACLSLKDIFNYNSEATLMLRWMYLCAHICTQRVPEWPERQVAPIWHIRFSHQILIFGSTGLAEIKTRESPLRVPAVLNHHSIASQGLEYRDSWTNQHVGNPGKVILLSSMPLLCSASEQLNLEAWPSGKKWCTSQHPMDPWGEMPFQQVEIVNYICNLFLWKEKKMYSLP